MIYTKIYKVLLTGFLVSLFIVPARSSHAQSYTDGIDATLRTSVGEITLSSQQRDFKASEEINFEINKGYSGGFSAISQFGLNLIENGINFLGGDPSHNIKIEIKDPRGELIKNEEFDYKNTPDDLSVEKRQFAPGKYSLTITDVNNGNNITQDFTWGVLAINTNKSIYTPAETAKLTMAVLDEKGDMVCDALLRLNIQASEGQAFTLSTSDGSIKVNPECEKKEYTLNPDFSADLGDLRLGKYDITLTAETDNGIHTITDSFEVKESVDFEIERISATRLYPVNDYPVIIKVKANKDFRGVIEETMPEGFMVYYLTGNGLSDKFNIQEDLEKGLVKTLPGSHTDTEKTIRWEVDWKKGENYALAYYFNPPDKSPDFFTLGLIRFMNLESSIINPVYQESRYWQLANDASGDIILLWDTANGSVPGGWTSLSDSGGAYYGVMPRGAASYGSSTAGVDSHTPTVTYSSATAGASGTALGSAGSAVVENSHTHTWTSPTVGSESVLPLYKNLKVIYANNPSTLPSNIIGIFDTASPPSGWTGYDALNTSNRHLRGFDDNATGGATTHSHTIDKTSDSASQTMTDSGNKSGTGALAHSHTLSGSTDNATNAPPYVDVYFAYNSSGSSVELPNGLIALFNATPPTNWSSVSGSTPYQNNFLRGATSGLGSTGGSSSDHTHNGTKVVTSGTGGATAGNLGNSGALTGAGISHTHDVTYTVGSSASLPVYRDTIIGKYTAPGDTFEGYVYTDDTEGTALGSVSVCLAVNATHNAADCDTTDGAGQFSFVSAGNTSTNDQLTFFLDGGTYFGNTVTVGTGGNITTLKLYQNHVIVRHDQGSSITIAQMDGYDNSTGNTTDMLFDATDSTTDTLTVEDGYEFYIPSGVTFAPAGNLDNGAGVGIDDIKIVGTYTASTSQTILVSGSWVNSGVFTCSTSTVTFDAPGATTETFNDSTPADSFYNLVFNDGGGGATFQLSTGIDVNNNLTISGGTFNSNGYNVNVGGIFTNNDSYTSGITVFTMDGAGGSIAGTSNTSFYILSINPSVSGTITLTSSDPVVTAQLAVMTGDSLSLSSGRTITLSGNTLTLDGTISGAGTFVYQGSGNLPTGGTLSALTRFDATNNNQTISNRTYGGNVEIYNNSGASDRTFTLGTAGSQTITFSGNVTLNAANTRTVTLSGSTYNPAVNITGNITGTSGGGLENITTGTNIWSVGGNIDLTNVNTFTATTGNVMKMTGTSKTVTSAGKSFYDFQVAVNGNVSNVDALDVDGDFTVYSTNTFAMATGAINVYVAGDFTLYSGSTFTGNTTGGKLIFNGATTYTDSRATVSDVGDVQIGNSPGTTNLATDFAANSLTVVAGDDFNTCNYDLDIGNGGIILNTGSPGGNLDASENGTTVSCSATEGDGVTTINNASLITMSSGSSFVYSDSSVIMDDNDGTNVITSSGNSFYDLTIDDSNNDATLIIQIADALDIQNNLNITDGTLDANSGGPYQINVGGNWDNDSTFLARGGSVYFDAASGTKTIDADGTGTDVFYNVYFNDGVGTAGWQLTTAFDADYNFTITDGTVDANGQTIYVGNNYSNAGTFTANSGIVTMNAQDAGNTLSGTMTGSSSFYDLVFNDSGTSGAWSFAANSATVTHDFTITGGAVTAPSTTLTIAEDFTNGDSFTHNSGTVVFNTTAVSILSYSAATTFNNFTVNTGNKQIKFDDTYQTNIAGLFNIQGTDCGTQVFLDSETNDNAWDIYVSGTYDIDYADVEDSTAITTALTANNSYETNDGNTNWTITSGSCGASQVNIRGDTVIKGGVVIK